MKIKKEDRGLGRRKGKERLQPKPPNPLYFTVRIWLWNVDWSRGVTWNLLKSRSDVTFKLLSEEVVSLRKLYAGKDSVANLSNGFEKKSYVNLCSSYLSWVWIRHKFWSSRYTKEFSTKLYFESQFNEVVGL